MTTPTSSQDLSTGLIGQATRLAIGHVRKITGVVKAIAANGEARVLAAGDAVHAGDTIETGMGASLGVVFVDRTSLALGESAHLTLDRFLFDPDLRRGVFVLSVIRGAFLFLSGEIGKLQQDALQLVGLGEPQSGINIKTSVATIGVRGTIGGANVGGEGEPNQFTLFPDPSDPTRASGVMIISNGSGGPPQILDQPWATTTTYSFLAPPLTPFRLDAGMAVASYGSVLPSLPVFDPALAPPPPNHTRGPALPGDLPGVAPAAGPGNSFSTTRLAMPGEFGAAFDSHAPRVEISPITASPLAGAETIALQPLPVVTLTATERAMPPLITLAPVAPTSPSVETTPAVPPANPTTDESKTTSSTPESSLGSGGPVTGGTGASSAGTSGTTTPSGNPGVTTGTVDTPTLGDANGTTPPPVAAYDFEGTASETLTLAGRWIDYTIEQDDDGGFSFVDRVAERDGSFTTSGFGFYQFNEPALSAQEQTLAADELLNVRPTGIGLVQAGPLRTGVPGVALFTVSMVDSDRLDQLAVSASLDGATPIQLAVDRVDRDTVLVRLAENAFFAEPGFYFLTIEAFDKGGQFAVSMSRLSVEMPEIRGTKARDLIDGGPGGEVIFGLSGSDTLRGNGGGDMLDGGEGADWIWGGAGFDRMTGGTGADRYVFDLQDEGARVETNILYVGPTDIVTDFNVGDRIVIVDRVGVLPEGARCDIKRIAPAYDGTNADGARGLILDGRGMLIHDANGSDPGYNVIARVSTSVSDQDVEVVRINPVS
jgi:hypothetical protein